MYVCMFFHVDRWIDMMNLSGFLQFYMSTYTEAVNNVSFDS